jgi:hypothetical protein
LLHPAGDRVASASTLGAELIELVRPAARGLGGEEALGRLRPADCEAELQLTSSPLEAAADLVTRSLG